MLYPLRGVDRVQVEDRAGIRLLRPGQECLVFLLYQPDSAVDQFDIVLAEVIADLGEKRFEIFTRHVDFGDDLGCGIFRVFFLINLAMVVDGIDAHLVGI